MPSVEKQLVLNEFCPSEDSTQELVFELISDVLGSSIETFSMASESVENDQA